jgi:hypothetical protein
MTKLHRLALFSGTAVACAAGATAAALPPALTIYNGDFAVVRQHVPLDLQAGENRVRFSGVTTMLEPDSVVLRDPADRVPLRILEQGYRADAVSQGLLLSLHEGRTLDFIVRDQDAKEYTVKGRVVRSGYLPGGGGRMEPLIEVDGQLRFSLPGEPIFPALDDDAILQPTLDWVLHAERAGRLDAELGYVTAGLSWHAAYNLVAPETGDTLDIVGWVTMRNNSGKRFDDASIKLMAGQVNKVRPAQDMLFGRGQALAAEVYAPPPPQVTEKSFDEFHLYSLPRPTTLRDRETKQVEFIRAEGVKAQTLYIYNGAAIDPNRYAGWNPEMIRQDRDYGTQSNKKVWVMREFENSEENGLGLPLPAGRTRFYRRDDADGRLEFTGENTIDHTPRNETVRIYTGDAFDVVGERKRTDHAVDNRADAMEEAFEIRIRNRKATPVEVRVVERLYRGPNWQVRDNSAEFIKNDAQEIEFRVSVPADGETVVTYRVRYTWR